ncbi:MAG: putative zinc-finger [Actinomycetota bacterium]|jgi:mycothiol system anti-sigma-R factor
MGTGTPEVSCAEALERVELALDGVLAEAERAQLELHLESCRDCAGHADTLERIREALRTGCCEPAPPELARRVRLAIAELRGDDGG